MTTQETLIRYEIERLTFLYQAAAIDYALEINGVTDETVSALVDQIMELRCQLSDVVANSK